jgi:peptidoglycan/LPS O-acetylase OafA/YrhL
MQLESVVSVTPPRTRVVRTQRSLGVDALRGIAAVMVLSAHALTLLVPVSDRDVPGWALLRPQLSSGFQLFFVVSGFLIAGPFLRDLIGSNPLPRVWPYAVRRILRIGPAFWVVLLAFALVIGGTWSADDWIAVITHATFTQDLVLHQSGAILPVAWTLGIEALFYVFVPAAAFVIRRQWQRVTAAQLELWICVAWALSVAWELGFSLLFHAPYGSQAVSPRDDTLKLFTISLPGMFCLFCPGLLVAVWRVSGRNFDRARRHPGSTVLAGCGLWLITAIAENAIGGSLAACLGDQLRGVAFAAVLVGAVSWQRPPGLILRSAAGLGVVSYGIYLWHWLVIHGIEIASGKPAPFGGVLGTPTAVGISLLATLPFALISWYVVESPCQRLAAAIAHRPPADVPAVSLDLSAPLAPIP